MREADLAAERALQVVVQDLAVDLEQLGGDGRTDVAVGTPRLASMFSTMRAAEPRSGAAVSPSMIGGPDDGPVGFATGAAGVGAGAAGAAVECSRGGRGLGAAGARLRAGWRRLPAA